MQTSQLLFQNQSAHPIIFESDNERASKTWEKSYGGKDGIQGVFRSINANITNTIPR